MPRHILSGKKLISMLCDHTIIHLMQAARYCKVIESNEIR